MESYTPSISELACAKVIMKHVKGNGGVQLIRDDLTCLQDELWFIDCPSFGNQSILAIEISGQR